MLFVLPFSHGYVQNVVIVNEAIKRRRIWRKPTSANEQVHDIFVLIV